MCRWPLITSVQCIFTLFDFLHAEMTKFGINIVLLSEITMRLTSRKH